MTKSPIDLHLPYQERVNQALGDRHLRTALGRATGRMSGQRRSALDAVVAPELLAGLVDGGQGLGVEGAQEMRRQMRQMKEHVLRHLPILLEEFERRVTENGGSVHWANDGAELNGIVLDIARRGGVEKVVKAKSMATEETHLNTALERAGLKVVETDLGEYIIQLVNEPPSHIVAPIVHKRIEDVSAIFQRELDMPPTLDPEIMCGLARNVLRREFLSAEMGISGCNFAIAESGTVCIVTNEGNGRMTAAMPRIYVVVMGIEKIVATVEDAFLQYQALCRSATGQQTTVYMNMTSGPRGRNDPDGPAEFHVVLLDNGRTDMLEKGYGEALLCIRCGACLNVCPVYREIGGHAYGSTYSGPIGAVISPLLNMHVTDAHKLPYASTLCGACRDACPVKIDLPRLLVDLRADSVEQGAAGWSERQAMVQFARMMGSRRAYESMGSLAGFGTGLLGFLSGGSVRSLPPPFNAWTKSRDFPGFARRSFRTQWAERMRHAPAQPRPSPIPAPAPEVVAPAPEPPPAPEQELFEAPLPAPVESIIYESSATARTAHRAGEDPVDGPNLSPRTGADDHVGT
jgi:L-lactate dehydrogenase complex protein LldF